MAQGRMMRIKDQDLVLAQVREGIESKGLEEFENRKDVQALVKTLDSTIVEVEDLVQQRDDLTKSIKMRKKVIEDLVKEFHETNDLESIYTYGSRAGQGFDVTTHYSDRAPSYKVRWYMPIKQARALETKLRLTTMGGDFDVYKMIEELTAEFSS